MLVGLVIVIVSLELVLEYKRLRSRPKQMTTTEWRERLRSLGLGVK